MKILMSDFDKTFFQGFKYSDRLRAAVKKWHDAGNIVAISTARCPCRMHETAMEIDLDCDYYICENGTVIYDKGWNMISFSVPEKEEIMDVFRRLVDADYIHLSVSDGLTEYAVCKNEPLSRETPVTAEELYKLVERPLSIHANLKNRDALAEICDDVNGKGNGTVFANYWGGNGAFFYRKNNNKAIGGYKLLRIVGGKKEDVYAIGDGTDDTLMFKEFKGYAMSCASEEVKSAALGCYNSVEDLIESLLD